MRPCLAAVAVLAIAIGRPARAEGLSGDVRDTFIRLTVQACLPGLTDDAKAYIGRAGLTPEQYCSCTATKVADGTNPAELTPERMPATTETIKQRSVEAAQACIAHR